MRSLLTRCLYAASITMFGMGLTTAASAASPSEGGKSTAPGEFQIAQRGRDICCRNRGRYYWTTHHRCERSGGSHVRDRYCRRDRGHRGRRICCDHHGRYRWMSHRRCERHDGHHVSSRYCRDGRRGERGRVCCKRGRYDWWTSSVRRCRRAGGHVVAPRACRRGPDDRGHHGRDVCCYKRYRGYRRFRIMSRYRCDRWGGRSVRWRYCRR